MAADDPLQQLRGALERLAEEDAPEVLAPARADARRQVRKLLADALSETMLAHLSEHRSGPSRGRESPAPPEAPAPTERQPLSGETAWYVYGVVGADEVPAGPLPSGVEPSLPAEAVQEAGLAAIVCAVAVEDFGEAQLRAHLADMEWVERIARGHEHVLSQLRERTTVIPMRMCTVYRSEEGVREMLRREADELKEALVHLDARTEWGVKVFALPAQARAAAGPAPASGTAYMEQRRRARDEAELAVAEIQEAAATIHEALCSVAADGRVVPSQRREASGHAGEMVLNGVYLVDDEAESSFHERVRSLQAQFADAGLELQTTGPWPAYNFVPGAIGAGW